MSLTRLQSGLIVGKWTNGDAYNALAPGVAPAISNLPAAGAAIGAGLVGMTSLSEFDGARELAVYYTVTAPVGTTIQSRIEQLDASGAVIGIAAAQMALRNIAGAGAAYSDLAWVFFGNPNNINLSDSGGSLISLTQTSLIGVCHGLRVNFVRTVGAGAATLDRLDVVVRKG